MLARGAVLKLLQRRQEGARARPRVVVQNGVGVGRQRCQITGVEGGQEVVLQVETLQVAQVAEGAS